jgi:UDP-N-acetylmuramate--alanine ligase
MENMTISLQNIEHIHIVGIGGAGMSAIAHILLDQGKRISGSDIKESRYVTALRERGATIHIGHAAFNIDGAELVVYSTAIRENNPELVEARNRRVPLLHRSALLGPLSAGRRLIAVTGTHGKTTTTSLIASLLTVNGDDPGFLIGGELNEIGTNARNGSGAFFVLEADESDGSFLHVAPEIAVVTNIENDHLDHYGDMSRLFESFLEFGSTATGTVVACLDDEGSARLARELADSGKTVVTYGLAQEADIAAREIRATERGTTFTAVDRRSGATLAVETALRGAHNVRNLLATFAVARCLGIPDASFSTCAREFKGVVRRFQLIDQVDGIALYDDYAHHPTEIKATLAAASEAGFARVIAVFQPHRYSRAALLMEEFGRAFDDADVVVATELYAAGEEPIPGVSGKRVFERICENTERKQLAFIPRLVDIPAYLASRLRAGDAVFFIGAGDVNLAIRETADALRALARTGRRER